MIRSEPAQQIIDQMLELNEAYQESIKSSNGLNSPKRFRNEYLIQQLINKVISYNPSITQEEQLDILDTFKAHNVNFDARSRFKDTSLLYAYSGFHVNDLHTHNDYVNNMKLLLDYGANPDFYRQSQDQQTCLMASIHDRTRFKLLLDHGADPTFIPNQKWSDIAHFITDMLDCVEQRQNKKYYDIRQFIDKSEELKINRDYAQSLIQRQLMTNQISSSQVFINSDSKDQKDHNQSNDNQPKNIISHHKKQKTIL